MVQDPNELKNKIIKLFNAHNYEVISKDGNYYHDRYFLIKKTPFNISVYIKKDNNFLKLKENLSIDIENNPKRNYYINFEDLDFLLRENLINKIIND